MSLYFENTPYTYRRLIFTGIIINQVLLCILTGVRRMHLWFSFLKVTRIRNTWFLGANTPCKGTYYFKVYNCTSSISTVKYWICKYLICQYFELTARFINIPGTSASGILMRRHLIFIFMKQKLELLFCDSNTYFTAAVS